VNNIKVITQYEIKKLVDKGFLTQDHRGFVNKKGSPVGFTKTVHKRYIEDFYADKAKTL